jgi:hypothetical protein
MEALSSSETAVLTGATWRNIPEDDILHSHRRENLNSYMQVILHSYLSVFHYQQTFCAKIIDLVNWTEFRKGIEEYV